MGDEMILEIPADAAYAVTARQFVVAAGRDLGVGDGTVEDLRLVASELVANAVETGERGPIQLTLRTDHAGIHLDASGVGTLVDEPPISRRVLLESLFGATDIDGSGGVHIRVPAEPRAEA